MASSEDAELDEEGADEVVNEDTVDDGRVNRRVRVEALVRRNVGQDLHPCWKRTSQAPSKQQRALATCNPSLSGLDNRFIPVGERLRIEQSPCQPMLQSLVL